jgi:IS5 family transposase
VQPPEGTQLLISCTRGLPPALKKALKRRQAIEPTIGHMKTDGLLTRNRLKVNDGDAIHAVLCGAGHNLRLILAHLRALRLALIVLASYVTNMLRSACRRAAATIDEGLGGAMLTAHVRRWT